MQISEIGIFVGVISLFMSFMINLILMAYQWGKFQQIVHDLKEVVGNIRDAITKGDEKLNDHSNRIVSLETHTQIHRGRQHG